jgi:spermidine synthase
MSVFIEKQSWGETHYEVVPHSHVSFQTSRQRVDLITNSRFGRMLFLDGVLQSASVDEDIYHKGLVSFGLTDESKHILIAGGAEGGVIREVAKYDSVEKIMMIDWDAELVEHLCKRELMNTSAFSDPRLNLLHEDILDYLGINTAPFDTVFLDLLDIHTEEEYQFTLAILEKLPKGATVVMNIGSSKQMAERFCGEIREIFVPSFQEPWYLVKLLM